MSRSSDAQIDSMYDDEYQQAMSKDDTEFRTVSELLKNCTTRIQWLHNELRKEETMLKLLNKEFCKEATK